MTINKYGVQLVCLSSEHLEMVRNWRNDPKIAQHMVSQNHISAQEQQHWFETLDQHLSPHFVIRYKEQYVGLCSIKRQTENQNWCETGMYIYNDDEYVSHLLAFRASLACNNYCFEQLNVEQIRIYVLAENRRALAFNKALGFIECKEEDADHRYKYYTLSQEGYVAARTKIERFL